MSAIPTFRIWRPSPASKPADAVRSLLTPAFPCTSVPVAHFSSSPIQCKGKGKGDNNPNRGVSPVRRTGLRPRQTLSVRNPGDKSEIPVPRKRTSQIQGDPNHGLYEFFRNKRLMVPPSQEAEHGRAWSVNELRGRDWETLQQLWWVCVKERNRIATEMLEMKRLNADYQMPMVEERDEQVQKTMKAIIDTLVERNIAYKDALKIAHQDPTVEFSRTGVRYQEQTYEADEVYNELDDPAGAVPNEVRENQPAAVDAVFEEPQRPRDTKSQ